MAAKMREMRHVMNRIEEPSYTDITALFSSTVEDVKREHPEALIKLATPKNSGAQVPSVVEPDIRELVTNSISATDDDNPVVTIEAEQTEDDWVTVTVTDNGPGLPEIEAEVLETGEEGPLKHGKGLGLWLVRMITKQAGGDIAVTTTGKGTEIKLTIPTKFRTQFTQV
jgi:signal transduction histidine kinase